MPDLSMSGGDLGVSLFGDIMVIDIDDDIIQSAVHNILLHYGEYIFNPKLGNYVFTHRNKMSTSNLRQIEVECANAIKNDNRVDKVQSIIATKNNDKYATCDISFSIVTTYGKLLSSRISISI